MVICNACRGRLSKYTKKSGFPSHSRLFCAKCGLEKKKRSKHFVDKDVNAAHNILWVGKSKERPTCLARNTQESNPPVGPGGISSDPAPSSPREEGVVNNR